MLPLNPLIAVNGTVYSVTGRVSPSGQSPPKSNQVVRRNLSVDGSSSSLFVSSLIWLPDAPSSKRLAKSPISKTELSKCNCSPKPVVAASVPLESVAVYETVRSVDWPADSSLTDRLPVTVWVCADAYPVKNIEAKNRAADLLNPNLLKASMMRIPINI